MRSLRSLALLAALALTVSVSAQDSLMTSAQTLFKPIPASAPELPGNPATPAKVELGKMLYFDPRLSASHAISCSSCHNVGLGGVDAEETSIGHQWQRGGRNAPTVLNAVFNTAQFWDGRAKDLEAQAGGPMINPIEMASPQGACQRAARSDPRLCRRIQGRIPGRAQLRHARECAKSHRDIRGDAHHSECAIRRYLKGDASALSTKQTQGLRAFTSKGCSACHNGINLGGGMYAPFGTVEKPGAELLPPNDKGRFTVTKTATDEYVFKVPTLRNIALTAPYFHSGRSWDLRQAVAVMGSSQLGAQLTADETERVAVFLESLTGDQPRIMHPILPPSVAATPRPQR